MKKTKISKKKILHVDMDNTDFLIDYNGSDGQDRFEGEWIHFGSDKFKNWNNVIKYLINE